VSCDRSAGMGRRCLVVGVASPRDDRSSLCARGASRLNDNLTALRNSHSRSKAPDTLTTVVYDNLLLPLHIGIPDIVSVSVNGAYSRLRTLQRHPELLPRDLTDIGEAVDGLARYRSRLVGSWWQRNVTKRGDFWLLGPLPGDRTLRR